MAYEPKTHPKMLYKSPQTPEQTHRIVADETEESAARADGWGDYGVAPAGEEELAATLQALPNKAAVIAYGAEHYALTLNARDPREALESAILQAAAPTVEA